MAIVGRKAEDVLDRIGGIMNIAASSGEGLATKSGIITNALTVFGLSVKDSSDFADILGATSYNANTNVAMMVETF